jgi:DNA primase
VSWTTRSISYSDRVTRYVSAALDEEKIFHKELLYGEDFARHAVIVNEGILDAWRIGPGAVATFGSGYSQEQLERIAKYPTRAICFDNEPEAQKRARKLSNDLSALPGETYNVLLDKKDAADESKENIKRLRQEILG